MSTKQEQVLKIDPPVELTFTGPFDDAVSSTITLTNPSELKVCYKIKTTAPKIYCVKPKSGVIDPKEEVNITVTLQPYDFDPREKNRHKFMVLSMYAPSGEFDQESLWKKPDSTKLMDSKLNCTFVFPESNEVEVDSDSWQSPGFGSGDSESVTIKEWKKMEKFLQLERLGKATQDLTSEPPLSEESNILLTRHSTAYSSSTTYLWLAALFLILGIIGAVCFHEDLQGLNDVFIANIKEMKSTFMNMTDVQEWYLN